jgi:hypothetical protein
LGRKFPVAGGLISYGASVPDALRRRDSLAIFNLPLAEQAHLHQELDHALIIRDARDTDASSQPASISLLSHARRCALEHAEQDSGDAVTCHGLARIHRVAAAPPG